MALTSCHSIDGLTELVRRRLPNHVDNFSFELVTANHTPGVTNDHYAVNCDKGTVTIQGNSLIALASG